MPSFISSAGQERRVRAQCERWFFPKVVSAGFDTLSGCVRVDVCMGAFDCMQI